MSNIRLAALCAAAMIVVLLTGCSGHSEPGNVTGPTGSTVPLSPSSATSTGSPTMGTTAPPVSSRALPIYYVVDTVAGLRLYREFHAVATPDPASGAVRELLAAPTGFDPDYLSHWPAGTRLRSTVRHAGGVITVDLSGEARSASVGSEVAEFTVQQLVYTVQGALQSTDPVQILIDGATVPELWGHVATARPIPRADQYRMRSLVQIDDPAYGVQVGRTFTVSGEAAAFEANVPWVVLRDGVVVGSGAATAAEGQRFSPFRFSLTLDPGEYTLLVSEDDASGGAGRPPLQDTKLIRVTG
jgi:Sporulation and spore germination/Immunoglobulin-like domain of bacterial spore germination